MPIYGRFYRLGIMETVTKQSLSICSVITRSAVTNQSIKTLRHCEERSDEAISVNNTPRHCESR